MLAHQPAKELAIRSLSSLHWEESVKRKPQIAKGKGAAGAAAIERSRRFGKNKKGQLGCRPNANTGPCLLVAMSLCGCWTC
jgi:hypothetical protein